MDKPTVALYDPQFQSKEALKKWLDSKKGECEVKTYVHAEPFVHDILSDYRPTIALIDISGDVVIEPVQNMVDIFDQAALQGMDIMRHIDQRFLEERRMAYWLYEGFYGIGLLALLKAVCCPIRVAMTYSWSDWNLVDVLMYNNLANGGVCSKEDSAVKRRLAIALKEMTVPVRA